MKLKLAKSWFFVAVVLCLSLSLGVFSLFQYSKVQAIISDGANAVNVLGQTDENGDLDYNNDGQGTINDGPFPDTFYNPKDLAIDTVNHRLFVSDNANHRILVMNLNDSNVLVDYDADFVLGQPDLYTGERNNGGGGTPSASGLNNVEGLAYDVTNDRLFVSDYGNTRVLVFDTTAITNGENAVAVLGQSDFITRGSNQYSGAVNASDLTAPAGLAYDSEAETLFVADSGANRIMVFLLADGITNGEDAIYVFGQSSFTGRSAATTQSGLNTPVDVAYDPRGFLYAVDQANYRILVYDVRGTEQEVGNLCGLQPSNVANGLNASCVYGQASFTANVFNQNPTSVLFDSVSNVLFVATNDLLDSNYKINAYDVTTPSNNADPSASLGQSGSPSSENTIGPVYGMTYDSTSSTLLASSTNENRILIYDLAQFVDGEPAAGVIGQYDSLGEQDFTKSTINGGASQAGLFTPQGLDFDYQNHRLFLADSANNRVLIYNLNSSDELLDNQPDNVLGQADFLSDSENRGGSRSQNSLSGPSGLSYDSTGGYLYVSDQGNQRVLVFDVNAISNGENAINVIGQTTFTGNDYSCDNGGFIGVEDLVLDVSGQRLFVANSGCNRVQVYDISVLANGLTADFVIGQQDLDSDTAGTTASVMSGPDGLAYDQENDLLFVAESGNRRVSIFDVSSVANGESAQNVLGQDDFVSSAANVTQAGMYLPGGLDYDSSSARLFVADRYNTRVSIYDVDSINDGEAAVNVLGQADFTTRDDVAAIDVTPQPAYARYNSSTGRLYASDELSHRVMVFDASLEAQAALARSTNPLPIATPAPLPPTNPEVSILNLNVNTENQGSVPPVDFQATPNVKATIQRGTGFSAIFNEENHSFQVTNVDLTGGTVEITVKSEPQKIYLKKGQNQDVDVNADGLVDANVKVDEIYSATRVKLTVTAKPTAIVIKPTEPSAQILGFTPVRPEEALVDLAQESLALKNIVSLTGEDVIELNDWQALYFLAYGNTAVTRSFTLRERTGLLQDYWEIYGQLPQVEAHWETLAAQAAGTKPVDLLTDENKAVDEFQKLFQRKVNLLNPDDTSFVQMLAYRLRPAQRDLWHEELALMLFVKAYGFLPQSGWQWSILRALAYTQVK